MTRTIRAALCRQHGDPFTVEEVRLAPPRAGEVQVEIDAVAVCHSDISFAGGSFGGHLPAVYGHEAVGRVSAVGEGVTDRAEGDVVLVTLMHSCGRCVPCRSGRPVLCENVPGALDHLSLPDGTPVERGLQCGAFAEAVTVHASQTVKVPADLPRAAAATLSCGVITGVGAAVNSAGIRAGEDVVVIGAGGVGLNAIQGARLAGARRIVAVDLQESKLEDARAFGATDAVRADDRPWRAVRGLLGRGADAVLVCVGVAEVYDDALRYAAPGGRVVAVGMPAADQRAGYGPMPISWQAQGILGSKMGDVVLERDIPWMVDLWRQGRLKLDELVSRTWTLEEINEAVADTKAGAARRNVIAFG